VNAFAKEKGIPSFPLLYQHVKRDGWIGKRAAIITKSLQEADRRVANKLADKWEKYSKTNNLGLKHVHDKLLAATNPETGDIAKHFTFADIKLMADAIGQLIKNESFMMGGPTERVEARSVNIHAEVVGAIEREGDVYDVDPDPPQAPE